MKTRSLLAYSLCSLVGACACTTTPDDVRDEPLSEECELCLQADDAAGCGIEEEECSADADCENALLCALRSNCFNEGAPSNCVEVLCEIEGEGAATQFDAFEGCARSICASVCDFEKR